jgi:endo-1,4-beta-D-glucanase Y
MLKKGIAFFFFCVLAAHSAVNFPYPQEKSYGYGTINTTSANASATLKSKFTNFVSRFYEEGTGSNSNLARIKFDNASQTVSEGIGYGMLMMVYFSDNTNSYQSRFDKLWAYYNKWLNENGLMNWRIEGFNYVSGQNAATDAEFDVALALAMAYYQFGDEKYRTDASALIAKVRQHEMESNGLHKPGDAWNDKKNPSYVSPAAFEIFKYFDDAEFWNKALTINYTLLKNNQNSTTGLPTDWCSTSGNPVEEKEFGYDASRAPWRWAWANAWYGHEDAKTLLAKIAPWVNGKTPANINGPLDASNGNNKGGCCNNSTFLGPLTNALSYSSSYQAKMNSFWNTLMEKSDESYFNAAMQLITGLLASGNMPNLKAMSDGTPILLPQIVQGNTLNAMQNAIYLQVAKNANLEVFSLNGNFIRKFEFSKGAYSVPLGDLPKGIYVVMASFGNEKRVLHIPIR